ncbi:transposon Tf2-9 polyprotein [Trichonephila clavipes]|nr:transposon Tf2-9 polyprotein [Trichonephila clavipes]
MQARRLKPTETLQEYFLTMRNLAHKGAVDDSSLIDYIIDGIPDSSNNKIILYGSKTLSEFKDKLKIYETFLNSKHSKQFPDKRFRDYENSTFNQHRIEHKRFTNQCNVASPNINIERGRLLCGSDTHTCILHLQRNPFLTPEESSPVDRKMRGEML